MERLAQTNRTRGMNASALRMAGYFCLLMGIAGKGLIQMRKIGTEEVLEFYVSGDAIQAVHMLPGYTHNLINLSETEDLVTVMWANEAFDPGRPDTYFERV